MSTLLEYGIVGSFDQYCLMQGDDIAVYTDDFSNKGTSNSTDSNDDDDDDDNSNDDEIGVSYLEIQFNYQALAAQLYHRFGVRENDNILLLLKEGNTAAEITSILACARLGSPFVPVDPTWMHFGSRFKSIIEDVKPVAAIVVGKNDDDEMVQLLASLKIYRVALINEDGSPVMEEASVSDIRSDLPVLKTFSLLEDNSDNNDVVVPPLYILFTSGSSGKPKGVKGSHHGLLNRIHWQYSKFPYELGEVAARRTPLTFVDSIVEILAPILAGVPLWTIKKEAISALGLSVIAERASKVGVTRLTILPSQLSMAIKIDKNIGNKWQCLKYIVVSGEPCYPILLKEISLTFPNSYFINLYGSTEVSGDVSYAILQVPKDIDSARDDFIAIDNDTFCPIGIPIINNELFVVNCVNDIDLRFEHVNDGQVGELLISGPHLAWGYHNYDGNKFIDFPFGNDSPVSRVFRTGDLVSKTKGVYTWIGRKDYQVKIRGIRIEIEEVERLISTIINSFVGIAVVAIPMKSLGNNDNSDANGDDKRLVSFVESKIVAEKYLPTTSHDLQRLFTRCLPSAFVPTLVLIIDQLPMTTSGKVDRTKLIEFLNELFTKNAQTIPSSPKTDLSKEDEESESIKKALIELYKPILPSLSLKVATDSNIYMENFFSLGGDSMTAVEVLWKIKKKWNLTVPFDLLNQSVELQALAILRLIEEGNAISIINETKKGVKRSFDWDDSYLRNSQSHETDSTVKIVHHAMASDDFLIDDSEQKKVFNLKESWHYQMSKCVDCSPLLVQSSSMAKLYIGDHSGQLIALDAMTGSTLWTINVEMHIENAIVINPKGNTLYVTAFAGNDVDGFQSKIQRGLGILMAVNAQDGNVIWSAYTEGEIKQSAVTDQKGKYIFVGTYDKSLYRFKSDGSLVDKINCDGSIYSKVSLSKDESKIFVATTQGKLICISIEKAMKIDWMVDVDAPVFASIVLSQSDLVLCAAVDGVLRAFNSNSQLVWTAYATRPIFSTPVIAEELNLVLFGSHDGYLRTVSLTNGDVLLEIDMGSVIYASPYFNTKSSLAIIATTSGDINIVDIRPKDDNDTNNNIVTKFRCSGEIYSSPIIFNDTIIVGCRDDRVYCIRIE